MNTNLTQRDPDGKFAPKFGKTWVKRQSKRESAESKRRAALMESETVRTWCAEHGVELQDAWMWF